MSVQKDGSAVGNSGTSATSSITGPSIAVASNSNRALLVHVLIGSSAVPTIDAVSWNSSSLTRIGSVSFGNLILETWRLLAPAVATAAPAVSITGTAEEWVCFAQSLYNVDQTTPEFASARTNSGSAGNAYVGCEGVSGGLAVGITMMGDAVSAIDSSDGTPQYTSVGTASQSAGATSINPTGAPAGRSYGGLEFCSVSTANNETISVSGTGWSAVGSAVASGSTFQERLFVRQYNGTNVDPTFSWTSSVACSARRWFVADAQATFGTQTSNTGSTSTHTINGNNATANNSLVMYLDHAKANTALGADAGYTERFDAGSATGPYRLVVGDRAEATSGAGADNFSATGANAAWVMQLLELLAQTSQTHEAEVENLDASVSAAVATEPGDTYNTIAFTPTGTVGEWAALAVTMNPASAGGGTIVTKSADDSFFLAEDSILSATRGRDAADTLATTDSNLTFAFRSRDAADSLATFDENLWNALRFRIAESQIALVDELVRLASGVFNMILTDAISIADENVTFMMRSRMLSDSVDTVSEGPLFRILERDALDSLSVTDDQLLYFLRSRLADDALSVFDEAIATLVSSSVISKILSSTLTTSDGLSAWIARTAQGTSSISTDDALQRAVAWTTQLSDAILVSDDKLETFSRFLMLDDSILMADDVQSTYVADQLYAPRIVVGTDQPNIKLGGYAL